MSGYVFAPEAEDDLFQVWRYLALEAGLAAADRVETRVFSTFELLRRKYRSDGPGISSVPMARRAWQTLQKPTLQFIDFE